MHFRFTVLLTLLYAISTRASLPKSLLYEFEDGVWIENVAVRSTGSLLATQLTPSPVIYELNPFAPKGTRPKALYAFPTSAGITALLGIVETTRDNFYVTGLNYSSDSIAPGSNKIYRFNPRTGQAKELVRVKEAGLLNGLTAVNDRYLLASDTTGGLVWSIDTRTGAYKKAIIDPLVQAGNGTLGVNGVKAHGRTLYFTNFIQAILGKVAINKDGTQAGKAVRIASGTSIPTTGDGQSDDFALDARTGTAWMAANPGNVVERVDLATGKGEIVAGNLNSTAIVRPTSAAFGRTKKDQKVLYVVTGGGMAYVNGKPKTVGGQIIAIKT